MVRSGRAESEGSESDLRQISLRRLVEFNIRPKRDLGQNFLIDDNILRVILGHLECGSDDVVLEVGAGLGVLTQALAQVACAVHAFEIDRSLREPLAATLRDSANVSLHFEDVLGAALEKLDPVPTLCASNLPYSVAGPFLVEAVRRLPSIRRYVVMVQKEVADRISAAPGGKAYGVLSVWVQLYTVVVRSRPLSRAIFHPQPHVDSSLLVLDRRPPEELPDCDAQLLETIIQAAFGQRRKTLANALAAGTALGRDEVVALLGTLGLAADVRAERLQPREFVELARRMAG
jgi:16S rRNA (adenine1518-N6/adenine1519-N6)-dimethyltransferase